MDAMSRHIEVHPEPVEGCRECANTSRPIPEGRTIDELLERARLVGMDIPEVDKLTELFGNFDEDVEAIRGMEPKDFEDPGEGGK